MGWLKIQKLEYLENEAEFYSETTIILTCASGDIFREVIVLL